MSHRTNRCFPHSVRGSVPGATHVRRARADGRGMGVRPHALGRGRRAVRQLSSCALRPTARRGAPVQGNILF